MTTRRTLLATLASAPAVLAVSPALAAPIRTSPDDGLLNAFSRWAATVAPMGRGGFTDAEMDALISTADRIAAEIMAFDPETGLGWAAQSFVTWHLIYGHVWGDGLTIAFPDEEERNPCEKLSYPLYERAARMTMDLRLGAVTHTVAA
jgi:hypothetical protein